ncbi:MAG: diguanylate cyclase [Vampirovibrionales bacterium]|nr:diguanylate cyclase [Vampirovibrionales bacterium]
MSSFWSSCCSKSFPISLWQSLRHWVKQWVADVFYSDSLAMGKRHYGKQTATQALLSPAEDIKHLMMGASSLDDIWEFFLKRLNATGTGLDVLCLSVIDESGDYIRVKQLHSAYLSMNESGFSALSSCDTPYQPIISMSDTANHLVQAYQRKDTTFTPSLKTLGRELEALLSGDGLCYEDAHTPMHLFSVPFIAADKTIAMMTLGFAEMDSFSQAKLSYVYTMRDQIAQLVWNLVLQERMKSQAQFDNLTGLLSHSYLQQALEAELEKARQQQSALTVMLLDINNIHQINEAYGHTTGDAAICHLASTVRRLIRGLDTVARYGGDDIVVLLPETDLPMAELISERFIQGLTHNLPKALKSIGNLSVSIGHATFPNDVENPDDLLKRAEQALHLAKFKGSKTNESIRIAASEVEQLNDKTVLEVFASHVAKKYNELKVPSLYQDLLSHFEKKAQDHEYLEMAQAEKSLETLRNDLMLETITSLACALDAKDRYTRGHSQAVANYAVALAHALKLLPEEVEEIRLAAFLHDIGKIGIPESILLKEGPLTAKELEIMKQHPVIGAEQILAPVSSLKPIIPSVLHHHENWDGSGYPAGLIGEDIPLGARIVSLVDVFHALTSDRSYRKALPVAEARKILEGGAGSKWDPHLIEVFFEILTIASPNSTATSNSGTSNHSQAKASSPVRDTVLNSPLVKDSLMKDTHGDERLSGKSILQTPLPDNVIPFGLLKDKSVLGAKAALPAAGPVEEKAEDKLEAATQVMLPLDSFALRGD